MPLTPEDVQSKRFSTVRFKEGYDEEEVDAFLDEVEAELRRLLAENESISRAPAPAAAPTPVPEAAPAPVEEPNEAALRTLLLAQRTADEAIAQAKSEAEQIVAQAKVRASSIESEAQQQHAAAMGELQRQRSTLEAQIEELRGFEREYRTRLKAYLEGQLRDLEARTAAPAGSPARPAQPPASAGIPRLASTPPATPPATSSVAPPPPPPPPPPAIPPLAPPAGGPPSGSPFAPAPPLVEDVDAGSDAPSGPPREALDLDDEAEPHDG